MTNRVALTVLLGCTALVAGCSKKTPAGQVAAVVNGQEITLQELNTELQASNVPQQADKNTVQRAILQRVIERKLLVGQAHDKGVDQTPDFLAQRRRADEMLLIQAYAKQQMNSVPVPAQADIDKFMTENANAFSKREQWILDQIRFPTPTDVKQLQSLQSTHSMAEVAAQLTKLGIKFERGDAGLDTAQVPPQMIAQINGVAATEPFVIPQPGVITVNLIKSRRPIPADVARERPAAVQAWRQRRFGEMLQGQVQQLKSSAKIEYQNGFGPPLTPKGAAPAPKAP